MTQALLEFWNAIRGRIWLPRRARFALDAMLERRLGRPGDGPIARVMEAFGRAFPAARFVQVGANDGVSLDPLHRQVLLRRWSGVMLEPVPAIFRKLVLNRGGCPRLSLENAALADSDGSLPFYSVDANAGLPQWLSLLGSFRRDVIARHNRFFPDIERYIRADDVRALTWDSLLERHGISQLDLVQIDAEGYDYELVRRLPFARVKPTLLMYEHEHLEPEHRRACAELLRGQGYELLETDHDTLALDVARVPAEGAVLREAWRRERDLAANRAPVLGAAPGAVPKAVSFSVVVTCYNYRAYVAEAIDAALAQQPAPLEVVVVDDGSTDGSHELLQQRYGSEPGVRIVRQENGGQLAAFVRGVRESRGDVVCFLDADDVWEPGYLARLAQVYGLRRDIDYVFMNLRRFGAIDQVWFAERKDHDCGISILDTYFTRCWIGSPTSALSMRRHWAEAIAHLPPEFYADWRTRADDCLVFGAGILGARKYFCADVLVRYRVHEKNNWFSQDHPRADQYLRDWRVNRLIEHFGRQMGIRHDHLKLSKAEFRTKPAPSAEECRRYQSMVKVSPLSWRQRQEHHWSIWWHQRHPDKAAARWGTLRHGLEV